MRYARKSPKKNPIVGMHPDLFGGETPIVKPLEEMSGEELVMLPHEELIKIPRDAFQEDQWDRLPKKTQEAIHEEDPESAARIEQMVEAFVERAKWFEEPDENVIAQGVESEIDYYLSQGEETYRLAESTRRGDDVFEIQEEYQALGFSEDQIREVLVEAFQDINNWDFAYGTDEFSPAFHKLRYTESFYMERGDIEKLTEDLYPDEIEAALKEINRKTYLDLEPKDLDVKYELDIQEYATHYADMDPDWEKIRAAVADALGEAEPEAEVDVIPPEERVVHTFPDKFFVLELVPPEMPDETVKMKHCIGKPEYGYIRAVKGREAKALSLRRPSGKPLLTFFVEIDSRGRPRSVSQIKGLLNRLPGWDLKDFDRDGNFVGDPKTVKVDEVQKAAKTVEVLGLDPEGVIDLQPALDALKNRRPRRWIRGNPGRRAHACPLCRANPGTGFCAPYRSRP